MARKQRTRPVDSIQSLRDNMERAYLEWKKWAGYHSWLANRELALQGGKPPPPSDPPSKKFQQEVERAFDEFDRAIVKLVDRDKTALGDPRIIERITQAQGLGDKKFFQGLGLERNVGLDSRQSRHPAIALIFRCAVEYLNGNEKHVETAYEWWRKFDIEKYRQKHPNNKAIADHWQKAKESITGESETGEGGGLENFKQRVKRLAAQLERGSIPIPKPAKHKPSS